MITIGVDPGNIKKYICACEKYQKLINVNRINSHVCGARVYILFYLIALGQKSYKAKNQHEFVCARIIISKLLSSANTVENRNFRTLIVIDTSRLYRNVLFFFYIAMISYDKRAHVLRFFNAF